MPSYTASRISADSNLLFPDRVDIDSERVIYYKGAVIGYQTTVIPRVSISSIRLISNVFFADIVIESSGGRMQTIRGLSKSDAREICQLLQ